MQRMRYLEATAAVAAATAIGLPLRERLESSEIVMIYLLAIVLVATRSSRGPAAFAAVLSVAAFDFLFVRPYYTFAVSDARYVLTFAVMLVVGLVIGTLTARVRQVAEAASSATVRARTEQLRNTLLSSVSHDLRTPLAAIKGAASVLLEQKVDEKTRVDMLATVQEEADRLERLVGNLLDITRLESGGITVRKQWVPLEEVVGSALMRMERRLAGRPVTTSIPHGSLVPLDDVLIENVLVNLLENVVRHTPPAVSIAIRAHVSDSQATIEVADAGPGLPAGTEEKVFEKFWQGPAAEGRSRSGAGLGLPICRGIVEAHGGKIVAVRREGGGTVFRITLPIEGAPPSVPAEKAAS